MSGLDTSDAVGITALFVLTWIVVAGLFGVTWRLTEESTVRIVEAIESSHVVVVTEKEFEHE